MLNNRRAFIDNSEEEIDLVESLPQHIQTIVLKCTGLSYKENENYELLSSYINCIREERNIEKKSSEKIFKKILMRFSNNETYESIYANLQEYLYDIEFHVEISKLKDELSKNYQENYNILLNAANRQAAYLLKKYDEAPKFAFQGHLKKLNQQYIEKALLGNNEAIENIQIFTEESLIEQIKTVAKKIALLKKPRLKEEDNLSYYRNRTVETIHFLTNKNGKTTSLMIIKDDGRNYKNHLRFHKSVGYEYALATLSKEVEKNLAIAKLK